MEFVIYKRLRKENILDSMIESITFYDIKPAGNLAPEGEVELVVKGGRKERFLLGPHEVKCIENCN